MAEVLFRAKLSREEVNTPWGFRLQGGVEYNKPLTLLKVVADSLAAKGGLHPGDIVVKLAGRSAEDMTHKDAQEAIISAGNALEIIVERADVTITSSNAHQPSEGTTNGNGTMVTSKLPGDTNTVDTNKKTTATKTKQDNDKKKAPPDKRPPPDKSKPQNDVATTKALSQPSDITCDTSKQTSINQTNTQTNKKESNIASSNEPVCNDITAVTPQTLKEIAQQNSVDNLGIKHKAHHPPHPEGTVEVITSESRTNESSISLSNASESQPNSDIKDTISVAEDGVITEVCDKPEEGSRVQQVPKKTPENGSDIKSLAQNSPKHADTIDSTDPPAAQPLDKGDTVDSQPPSMSSAEGLPLSQTQDLPLSKTQGLPLSKTQEVDKEKEVQVTNHIKPKALSGQAASVDTEKDTSMGYSEVQLSEPKMDSVTKSVGAMSTVNNHVMSTVNTTSVSAMNSTSTSSEVVPPLTSLPINNVVTTVVSPLSTVTAPISTVTVPVSTLVDVKQSMESDISTMAPSIDQPMSSVQASAPGISSATVIPVFHDVPATSSVPVPAQSLVPTSASAVTPSPASNIPQSTPSAVSKTTSDIHPEPAIPVVVTEVTKTTFEGYPITSSQQSNTQISTSGPALSESTKVVAPAPHREHALGTISEESSVDKNHVPSSHTTGHMTINESLSRQTNAPTEEIMIAPKPSIQIVPSLEKDARKPPVMESSGDESGVPVSHEMKDFSKTAPWRVHKQTSKLQDVIHPWRKSRSGHMMSHSLDERQLNAAVTRMADASQEALNQRPVDADTTGPALVTAKTESEAKRTFSELDISMSKPQSTLTYVGKRIESPSAGSPIGMGGPFCKSSPPLVGPSVQATKAAVSAVGHTTGLKVRQPSPTNPMAYQRSTSPQGVPQYGPPPSVQPPSRQLSGTGIQSSYQSSSPRRVSPVSFQQQSVRLPGGGTITYQRSPSPQTLMVPQSMPIQQPQQPQPQIQLQQAPVRLTSQKPVPRMVPPMPQQQILSPPPPYSVATGQMSQPGPYMTPRIMQQGPGQLQVLSRPQSVRLPAGASPTVSMPAQQVAPPYLGGPQAMSPYSGGATGLPPGLSPSDTGMFAYFDKKFTEKFLQWNTERPGDMCQSETYKLVHEMDEESEDL